MNRTIFSTVLLGFLSSTAIACGGVPGDDATRLQSASTTGKPSATAPYQRLYFDVSNELQVGGDVLGAVDLQSGANVELEAVTKDGSPIRFELWRVHDAGDVELVNAFDVESGFVLTSFVAPSDGRTLLHFPVAANSAEVVVHMECSGGTRCTATMQPSETCTDARPCDQGLLCIPSDRHCNLEWDGGTCALPAKTVTCDREETNPVCGCDGKTYADACLARVAGAGISHLGECTQG
jgi:hypothetical protein